jgi:hypothetical protein
MLMKNWELSYYINYTLRCVGASHSSSPEPILPKNRTNLAEKVPRNSKHGKISLEASPAWLLSAKYGQSVLVLYKFQPFLLYGPLLTQLW